MRGRGRKRRGSGETGGISNKVKRTHSLGSLDREAMDLSQSISPAENKQSSQPVCSTQKVFNNNNNNKRCKLCEVSWDVEDDDGVIQCDICSNYFHGSCLKFDEQTVNLLQVVKTTSKWVCPQCIESAKDKSQDVKISKGKQPTVAQEVKLLRERVCLLESALVNLQKELQSLNNVVSTDSAPIVNGDINTSFSKTYASAIKSAPSPDETCDKASILKAVYSEMQSKQNKRCNIVVVGLHPNINKDDSALFSDLCRDQLHTDVHVIKKCKRLAKHNNDGGVKKSAVGGGIVPPLLVTLDSEYQVERILRITKQLKNTKDPSLDRSIYINPDLTRTEALIAFEKRQVRRSNQVGSENDPKSHAHSKTSERKPVAPELLNPQLTSVSSATVSDSTATISSSHSLTSATVPSVPLLSNVMPSPGAVPSTSGVSGLGVVDAVAGGQPTVSHNRTVTASQTK